MRLMFVNRRHALAAAVLTLAALATPVVHAAAQHRARGTLRVALVDVFPQADARALVVREGAGDQPVTVVLRADGATADELGAAILLSDQIRTHPLDAGLTEVVAVRGVSRKPGNTPNRDARLNAILSRVRAQPHSRVGNLGTGRWADVTDMPVD